MSTPATIGGTTDLSPGQRAALVRLLEDEDPAVHQAVRERILACGRSAVAWLQPHALDCNPVVRRRVLEIIEHLRRSQADDRFLAFCLNQGEDFDLEQGVWLLALTRFPEINVAAYQALLDSYAAELRESMTPGLPAPALLEAVNSQLFERLAYRGNEQNYYDPDNSYLNRVMDRRTGNPISLCLVYLFLARRLHLPVAGIGMPGHFICRYQSSTDELFIDAFHQGRLLTKADCVKYLVQSSYGFQEGLLSPATPRRVLLRICSNLHQIYLHLKLAEETARLQRYVVALAK